MAASDCVAMERNWELAVTFLADCMEASCVTSAGRDLLYRAPSPRMGMQRLVPPTWSNIR